MNRFQGRLGLQQRVLPTYRAPFFEALAERCEGGMQVFAGMPGTEENIQTAERLEVAKLIPAQNRHIFNVDHPLYLCWQRGFLPWLQTWDPDILIIEANPRYPVSWQAIRWMTTRKRPVLGWGLGVPDLRGILAPLQRFGRDNFLKSVDALIAYSNRGAKEYQAYGIPADRIYIASNAVTPRPTTPPPTRKPGSAKRPIILFVGRLQARKRVDLLLKACADQPTSTQPRLWIIGDGPARSQLEKMAARVYPEANFFGARHGTDLHELYAKADVFVLPGTGGLAVQQAMAHGLPVIVAQGDGTQEDLVRSKNGWLVPPGDLPALTSAMQTALADRARLRQMGTESFRIVSEEINLEAMVEVFVEALNSF